MGPGGVAALSGGMSLVGGWMANRGRAKEADKNRRFQERMRNTQWQAAVADMRAAGLNPALAYSQGPNSAPGGSMAQQQDIVTPAVSSAMQMRQQQAQLRIMRQQEALVAAQAQKTQMEKLILEPTYRLWGGWEPTKKGGRVWRPGPLWDQHVSNARTADETWKAAVSNNVMLGNMARLGSTEVGRTLQYLIYMLRGR